MSELCSAGILGTGHYAPEKILSNADLERMVDTSDEWIRTRTGIETRHIASRSETTSDLCVKAALPALEMAGLTADDIDYIIVATASPDYVVPSTACMVQDKLGCKHAGAMDISAGCSGYIDAVALASNLVKAGMYKHILIIGAEILSRLVNWQDRSTCILFGDGAGAAVIGKVEDGYGLLASDLGSDGSLGKILNIPASGVAELVTRPRHRLRPYLYPYGGAGSIQSCCPSHGRDHAEDAGSRRHHEGRYQYVHCPSGK